MAWQWKQSTQSLVMCVATTPLEWVHGSSTTMYCYLVVVFSSIVATLQNLVTKEMAAR